MIAIDTRGVHFTLKERLRDLEGILPSYFIRINKSALAFLAGGMNVIYQVERMPLMAAILIHGGVLYVSYLVTYLVNGWLEWGITPILVFTGIFVLGYLVIWGIIYSVIRKKTDKLNEGLKKIQQHGII